MDIDRLIAIVAQSAVYCPVDDRMESMRIDYHDTRFYMKEENISEDDAGFYGTGEESGEEYKVYYKDVNLELDSFYRLELVNVADIVV